MTATACFLHVNFHQKPTRADTQHLNAANQGPGSRTHTYKSSALYSNQASDIQDIRLEQARQRCFRISSLAVQLHSLGWPYISVVEMSVCWFR